MTERIIIDYRLADPARPCGDLQLKSATEADLRYDCFLGDIILIVGDADFSARWGWVPVLDFALCLKSVASQLEQPPYGEERFAFTESEAEIVFRRTDATLTVSASYTSAVADLAFTVFLKSVEGFLLRITRALARDFPEFSSNKTAVGLLLDHGPGFRPAGSS